MKRKVCLIYSSRLLFTLALCLAMQDSGKFDADATTAGAVEALEKALVARVAIADSSSTSASLSDDNSKPRDAADNSAGNAMDSITGSSAS